jgi:hypothetical protein
MVQTSISREELREWSMDHQLGYLQHLAGNVWLREDLDQSIRDDALAMEELGVHWYKNLATGRCSLAVSLATDLNILEEKIIDDIMYYQEIIFCVKV